MSPAVRTNAGAQPETYSEELPPGHPGHAGASLSPQPIAGDPFVDDGYHAEEFGPASSCDQGYCNDGGCYGDQPCDSGTRCCLGSSRGQFFVTADYLYVRASFSEALAFVEADTSQQNLVAREFHQIDFEYESSYRVGGGYRWGECGDEIRFLHTRLNSSADELDVPFSTDILIPFEPGTPPGGRTLIDADVDLRSYDLECAKTIPLGGRTCCECGDPCGGGCGECGECGECCAPCCPQWDITWSGGIRAAEGGWQRSYVALDQADAFVGSGVSEMDFEGVGAKIGLEGRRYFFASGWLSAYMKGDISLLWGELDFQAVRTIEGGTAPDNVITQHMETEQIIPVTELEAGISGQVTCRSRISTGYLLSAWHDLGFRDEFALGQDVFPLRYDDANILGFDGWFARVEVAF